MNRYNVIKRYISNGCTLLREWKPITNRSISRPREYKLGDRRPVYMPGSPVEYPPYPYGESRIYKQSNDGLYGGSFIQFGNSISESKHKIRRKWYPNTIKKSLWSQELNKMIRMKLSTRVLKTISHEGGLDNYILKDKPARVKELGPFGWRLRYDILTKGRGRANASNDASNDAN